MSLTPSAEPQRSSSNATAPEPAGLLEHEIWMPGHGEHARTGVLLIHGLTGTPNEMRIVGRGLNKQGFTVFAVKLAGHCGTVEDLLATSWHDWLDSACRGAELLATHVDRIVTGGLSMGAVLALALAQRRPQLIDGVMALSTTFRHDGWSIPWWARPMTALLPITCKLGLARNKVFNEQPPYGIMDEALRAMIVKSMNSGDSAEAGLPGNPWWSVAEMKKLSEHTRRHLDSVYAPCLVMHARNDDIASVKNAYKIVAGARHAEVTLVLLTDSYHMITIDKQRRQVIDTTIAFVTNVHNRKYSVTSHNDE
ncbi:Thermostable monoacylglycerol lipase [Carnimonas sp. R-84981]|uniref:alpha/beta hydrolase n=1 Tax=Carnimonas bestiolae TaxID=3402172 RepID=UPI003EDC3569